MYEWRKMTHEERYIARKERHLKSFPSHNCPHLEGDSQIYHIFSSCYEHKNILTLKENRLELFQEQLLQFCSNHSQSLYAWCILPNHYHILLKTDDLKNFVKEHGKFHGRTSYYWNKEDQQQGRQCFHGQRDNWIHNEYHFWTTLNYIHNNPVHHKLVKKWYDWPYSSAIDFLEKHSFEEVLEIWQNFPVKEYKENWE